MKTSIPVTFDPLRKRASRVLAPIKPADEHTEATKDFLLSARRAVGPEGLPAPYLIYFLLVELLGYEDLGRWEKLAWSIPVDFEGRAFLIEHRKFGVGVFTQCDEDENAAKRIALLIKKGVRCARPFFEWKAAQAVKESQFNVTNNGFVLFHRYKFLKELYEKARAVAELRTDAVLAVKLANGSSYPWPYLEPHGLGGEARFLAIAAIDAFFSWTEHIFIHLAILNGAITTGEDFTTVSVAEWNVKFKRALDISDPTMKAHFDALMEIRRHVRNFVAHGAFGKDGQTLHFHSDAGAVPVLLDVTKRRAPFSLGEWLVFDAERVFVAIDRFLNWLSTGPTSPDISSVFQAAARHESVGLLGVCPSNPTSPRNHLPTA